MEMNYDDYDEDEETSPSKAKTSKAPPKFDDSEAFPDTLHTGGSTASAHLPSKSFASLAQEVLPPQKGQIDLNQPIRIKMPRKPLPPRIKKVRDMYKGATLKAGGKCKMYHDEGIPAGENEKKATCESTEVGSLIDSLRAFEQAWKAVTSMPADEGANIRLFKAEVESPSPDDSAFEKGGAYSFRVNKAIAKDMFEELALYFADSRVDHTVVGVCWCVRGNFDMFKLFTKSPPTNASLEKFQETMHALLGMDAEITYTKWHDAYKKNAARARKYYLVQGQVLNFPEGAAMSANNVVKGREHYKEKKARKTGADDYETIPARERREQVAKDAAPEEAEDKAEDNPYLLLEGDAQDEAGGKEDDFVFFEKKKVDKSATKKGSKRGSKKEKRSSAKEDFEGLPAASKDLIPQQIFIGSGVFAVVCIFITMYSSGYNPLSVITG